MTDPVDPILLPAEQMILYWKEALSGRAEQTDFHRALYEKRKQFHGRAPNFEQYQALGAYIDAMQLQWKDYTCDEERDRAYRETFGTAFPGASASDLQEILDEHLWAMSMAYGDELDSALGGVSL